VLEFTTKESVKPSSVLSVATSTIPTTAPLPPLDHFTTASIRYDPGWEWFLWEFVLLVSVYIFCILLLGLFLFLYIRFYQPKQKNVENVPQQFTYLEEPRKEELSHLHTISTTLIMASNMNRKYQGNKKEVKEELEDKEEKTQEDILDESEENNDNTEASEEAALERPTTGIKPETLIDTEIF
jgi:hypothetical protein